MIPCPVSSFILFCSIEVTWLFNANCAKLWFVGSLAWRWTQIPKDLISAIICNKTAWKIIRSNPSVVKLLLDCCGSFAALLFRRNCSSIGAQFSTGQLLIYWKGNQVYALSGSMITTMMGVIIVIIILLLLMILVLKMTKKYTHSIPLKCSRHLWRAPDSWHWLLW